MSPEQSNGFLVVRASSASGAIPVDQVTIMVQGRDEENRDVFLSRTTNADGITDKMTLPAPLRSLSEAPDPASKPYYSYNIEVYKDGYYPQHYNGVPIFAGITAVQNARLIPISEFDAQNPYTSEGQIFEEYENPYL